MKPNNTLYEITHDALIEALFNECFNIALAVRKQEIKRAKNQVSFKGVLTRNESYSNRLANKYNREIK